MINSIVERRRYHYQIITRVYRVDHVYVDAGGRSAASRKFNRKDYVTESSNLVPHEVVWSGLLAVGPTPPSPEGDTRSEWERAHDEMCQQFELACSSSSEDPTPDEQRDGAEERADQNSEMSQFVLGGEPVETAN